MPELTGFSGVNLSLVGTPAPYENNKNDKFTV